MHTHYTYAHEFFVEREYVKLPLLQFIWIALPMLGLFQRHIITFISDDSNHIRGHAFSLSHTRHLIRTTQYLYIFRCARLLSQFNRSSFVSIIVGIYYDVAIVIIIIIFAPVASSQAPPASIHIRNCE